MFLHKVLMWPHLPSVLPHDQEEFVDTALEETRGPDRLPYEYPGFFLSSNTVWLTVP